MDKISNGKWYANNFRLDFHYILDHIENCDNIFVTFTNTGVDTLYYYVYKKCISKSLSTDNNN